MTKKGDIVIKKSVIYGAVVTTLIILKIFGQITWSWVLVLLPIWLVPIYIVVSFIGVIFFTVWDIIRNYEYKGEHSEK